MSKLQEQLMKDLKVAMKEKDSVKKGVINLIRAGLQNLQIETKRELTEEDEIVIVRRELKQTNQTLEEGLKAGREDIVDAEKAKIAVIEAYLPKQLSEDELKEMIVSLGIEKTTPMGQAIGMLMKEVNGRADGKLVSQTVRDFLRE